MSSDLHVCLDQIYCLHLTALYLLCIHSFFSNFWCRKKKVNIGAELHMMQCFKYWWQVDVFPRISVRPGICAITLSFYEVRGQHTWRSEDIF
jgi:hypothetical protein